MPQRAHYPLFTLILISTTQGTLVDLSTLSALTWVVLIAAAALTGLAKTAIPGLASVAAALFALVLPAKESTGVMLALLLIGDMIALWAYRRDAVSAVLRRLVPSVLAPWCSRARGRGTAWPPTSRCASSNPSSSRRRSLQRCRCSYKRVVGHTATACSIGLLTRQILPPT